MKPTQELHDLGQSLWVDNITRTMLDDGTLARYIDELSVTGLTSNPTIFDKAIGGGSAYDEQIAELAGTRPRAARSCSSSSRSPTCAARPSCSATSTSARRIDGRVSLEVSPLLADDADATIEQAAELYGRAEENFFIKIPGTEAGRKAIEETIFAGIPVNVTLLFSTEHYLGAADAYMRGIERRIEAGLNPDVASVASLFISRWDAARRRRRCPDELRNQLGIAVGERAYAAYRELLDSDRALRLETRARGRSGCSGRAPGPRTPTPPTSSTSRAWRRRSPSTRCPRRRCSRSPTTARSASRCRADGGDAEEVAGGVRRRRDRHRRARGQAPGGRQDRVRRLLARAARDDRCEAAARPRRAMPDIRADRRPRTSSGGCATVSGSGLSGCSTHGAVEALAAHGAEVETEVIELDAPDDNEIDTSFAVISRSRGSGALRAASQGLPGRALRQLPRGGRDRRRARREPTPASSGSTRTATSTSPRPRSGYLDGMGVAILVGHAWQGLAAQVPGARAAARDRRRARRRARLRRAGVAPPRALGDQPPAASRARRSGGTGRRRGLDRARAQRPLRARRPRRARRRRRPRQPLPAAGGITAVGARGVAARAARRRARSRHLADRLRARASIPRRVVPPIAARLLGVSPSRAPRRHSPCKPVRGCGIGSPGHGRGARSTRARSVATS